MPARTLQAVVRQLHALGSDRITDRELLERFALNRDEAAFAEIVRRHGRLVHAVCRRLLGNHHDAEDAFQATFLVLARKASSCRWQSSLEGWLYRVAYHMAKKARESITRRRSREQKAASLVPPPPAIEIGIRDVSALLDDGLQALGARYRDVLIRCCLEDQTREAAARGLGLSQRTLERRLAKAKELLRGWLSRRGVTLSAALLAAALSKEASSAAVAVQAACATAQAACSFATGTSLSAGLVSAKAIALAQAALKRFTATKVSALIVGLVALCAGGWLTRGHRLAENNSPAPSRALASAENDREQKKSSLPRTDLFGEPLPAGAISRLGTLRMRHGEYTNFVRFTPNGKALVSHGNDGLRVWDSATGKLMQTFPGIPAGPCRPCLSADGTFLAIPSSSGIRLCDVATGRLIRRISNERSFFGSLAPDGLSVASSANRTQEKVTLLSTATGEELWSYSSGGLPWGCIDFSPDGREVVVAGWANLDVPVHRDNTIRFLDAKTGKELRRIDLATVYPRAIALSPRGGLIGAIGCFDIKDVLQTDLRVWDIATTKMIAHITPAVEPGRQRYFSALTFSPDGKSIVTAGSQDGLVVWDIATGKERTRLGHGFTNSHDLTFAPDGKSIAVAAWTIIRTISWPGGQNLLPSSTDPLDGQWLTAISPDRSRVVTAGSGPAFVTYDLRSGRELYRFANGEYRSNVALIKDGSLAFSIPYRGKTVTFWDVVSGKKCGVFTPAWIQGALECSFTPDARRILLSTGLGDTLHLVDWKTGELERSFRQLGHKISSAAFTADSRTLFVFCQDHTVHVWDAVNGTELRHFGPIGDARPLQGQGLPQFYRAYPSPDGKVLFYWAYNTAYAYNTVARFGGYTAQLFDTSTGKLLRPAIDKLREPPFAVSFSPDGHMLACSDEATYEIHLVEVRTGKDRRVLSGHRGPVRSLTFSPDGSVLVSASADTTSLVWDLTGQSTGDRGRTGMLSPSQLSDCWSDLCSSDAARAYQAIRKLADAPSSSVPFLAARLRTDPTAAAQRADRLIADLASALFATRENAAKELTELGPSAVRACERALVAEPAPEARARLEKILEVQRLPILRAVETLELAGTPQVRPLLQFLADGPQGSPIAEDARATLQRLERVKDR